ncbi:hypothetical protein DPMN_033138 [Dreissena polymorpha]|uniref:Uncharacterized protein n=1 Tax=Dreissena polymorpha TaxID=45954 RepID=A0A9D4M389_DREPO|nr:hypothetical protein DPMN_033138 [Dreissena polymorpha]
MNPVSGQPLSKKGNLKLYDNYCTISYRREGWIQSCEHSGKQALRKIKSIQDGVQHGKVEDHGKYNEQNRRRHNNDRRDTGRSVHLQVLRSNLIQGWTQHC